MAKVEKVEYYCDICDALIVPNKTGKVQFETMIQCGTVNSKPSYAIRTLDLCDECLDKGIRIACCLVGGIKMKYRIRED